MLGQRKSMQSDAPSFFLRAKATGIGNDLATYTFLLKSEKPRSSQYSTERMEGVFIFYFLLVSAVQARSLTERRQITKQRARRVSSKESH